MPQPISTVRPRAAKEYPETPATPSAFHGMPSNYNKQTGRSTGSPAESPSYFSGATSPRGASPEWRSTRRGGIGGSGFDLRRVVQVVVAALGCILIYLFVNAVFEPQVKKGEMLNEGVIAANHFVDYEGGLECRLSSNDLYTPPVWTTPAAKKKFPFCKNRADLLTALSGGGRHGYDMPYMPIGCHYKWYTPLEACMILDRFDGVVFIGDDIISQIYAAFNIILRRDLALGALKAWELTPEQRETCRCDAQYTNPLCAPFFVTSNDEVGNADVEPTIRSPYACNRIPHFYLRIAGSPAPEEEKARFQELLDKDKQSWKPVAIIHSLGLSTGMQWPQATDSMDEWLTIADNSGRNSPFLWVSPNAAGHMKPPAKIMQEGNNALWHYSIEMGKEAQRRGVESLGVYNSTLQANSFNGEAYGERVNLVQAMMVINWLARLETT